MTAFINPTLKSPTMTNSQLHQNSRNRNAPASFVPMENPVRRNSTRRLSHHDRFPVAHNNKTWRNVLSSRHRRSNLYLTLLILISCCCSFSTAKVQHQHIHVSLEEPQETPAPDLSLTLAELAVSGMIVVDQHPQPIPVAWELSNFDQDLRKRSSGDPFSGDSATTAAAVASASKTTSSTVKGSSATTKVASSTNTGVTVATAASGAASPLPSPFDTTLTNFTQTSCPNFINSFLSSSQFKACLPFSLLLQSSNSFFQVSKSLVRTTQTLDFTCAANVTSCTTFLSAIAANLTNPANCAADYKAQNPIVLQAYVGLIAYKPLYQASCLKNPETSAYCFAEAITNASSPTDSFIYYLPLNQSLPGGSQPTCDTCLVNTMAVFDAAAANRSQSVANTYIPAAVIINALCGPSFVNATIPAPLTAGSSFTQPFAHTGTLALFMMAMAWFL